MSATFVRVALISISKQFANGFSVWFCMKQSEEWPVGGSFSSSKIVLRMEYFVQFTSKLSLTVPRV
jgi:hypothetical protein